MGFSLDEYIASKKPKKSTIKGYAPGDTGSSDKPFSLDDYARAADMIRNGTQDQDNDYESLFNEMTSFKPVDYGNDNNRFDTYTKIDGILSKAKKSKLYYTQNQSAYDAVHGIGSAKKILDSIDQGVNYFSALKNDLQKNYDAPGSQQQKPQQGNTVLKNILNEANKTDLELAKKQAEPFAVFANDNILPTNIDDAARHIASVSNGGIGMSNEQFQESNKFREYQGKSIDEIKKSLQDKSTSYYNDLMQKSKTSEENAKNAKAYFGEIADTSLNFIVPKYVNNYNTKVGTVSAPSGMFLRDAKDIGSLIGSYSMEYSQARTALEKELQDKYYTAQRQGDQATMSAIDNTDIDAEVKKRLDAQGIYTGLREDLSNIPDKQLLAAWYNDPKWQERSDWDSAVANGIDAFYYGLSSVAGKRDNKEITASELALSIKKGSWVNPAALEIVKYDNGEPVFRVRSADEVRQVLSEKSPIAAMVGSFAGSLPSFMVGGEVLAASKIPAAAHMPLIFATQGAAPEFVRGNWNQGIQNAVSGATSGIGANAAVSKVMPYIAKLTSKIASPVIKTAIDKVAGNVLFTAGMTGAEIPSNAMTGRQMSAEDALYNFGMGLVFDGLTHYSGEYKFNKGRQLIIDGFHEAKKAFDSSKDINHSADVLKAEAAKARSKGYADVADFLEAYSETAKNIKVTDDALIRMKNIETPKDANDVDAAAQWIRALATDKAPLSEKDAVRSSALSAARKAVQDYNDPLMKAAQEAAGIGKEEQAPRMTSEQNVSQRGIDNTAPAPKIENKPVATSFNSNVDEGRGLNVNEKATSKSQRASYNDSGRTLLITGISKVENGKVEVATSDGNIPLDSITFDNPAIDDLYGEARTFDTKAAKTFVSYYDGNMPISQYYSGFTSIYGSARKGESFDTAVKNSMYAKNLTPEMQKAAYFAGQNAGKPEKVPASTAKAETVKSPAPVVQPETHLKPKVEQAAENKEAPKTEGLREKTESKPESLSIHEIEKHLKSKDHFLASVNGKKVEIAREPGESKYNVTYVLRINEQEVAASSSIEAMIETLRDKSLSFSVNFTENEQAGVVRKYSGQTTKAQEHLITAMDKLFKGVGRKVVIEDKLTYVDVDGREKQSEANAYFDPKTNEYHIALNSVGHAYMYFAVHESVHDIKANNETGYANVEKIIFDVLDAKGQNIDDLISVQKELHPNQDEAYWREEIVANTVPVILTDEQTGIEFAKRFVDQDKETQTVFKKILSTIKSFLQKTYNILKGQKSWEQMQSIEGDIKSIDAIRKAYMDALEGIQDNNIGSGETKFAKKDIDGKQYVEADRDVITGDDPKVWAKQVEDYINHQIRKGKDVIVYTANGTPLTITADTAGKASFRNQVTLKDGSKRLMTDDEYAVKLRAEAHIDELGEVSKGSGKTVPDAKGHIFAKDGFDYRVAYFKDKTGYYELALSVGKNGKINTIYNVGRIKEADFPTMGLEGPTRSKTETRNTASIDKISQSDESVNNSIRNTNDSDQIKFSLRDTTEVDMKQVRQLEKDKAKLEKKNGLLKAELRLTKGHYVSDTGINQLAGDILKETSSKYDKDTLKENLRTLFDYLGNAKAPVWDEVEQAGMGLAKAVIERSSQMNTDLYEYYADARENLKNTPVKLTSAQRAEAEYAFDSYRDFKRELGGAVKLTSDPQALSLDTVWGELSAQHPDLFDPDTNEADMVYALADAVQAMKPQYANPYGYNMDEAAYDLFDRIYDKYFELPEVQTFADKKQKELNLVRAQISTLRQEERAESKAQYDKKLAELRKESIAKRQALTKKYNEALEAKDTYNAQKLKERIADLTSKNNDKLLRQKVNYQNRKAAERERRAVQRLRHRIEDGVRELHEWFYPKDKNISDKKYVPEHMLKPVAEFISMLDFNHKKNTFKAYEWREKLRALSHWISDVNKQIKQTTTSGDTGYNAPEFDMDLPEEINNFVENNKNVINVAELPLDQLRVLDELVDTIRYSIVNSNRCFAGKQKADISHTAESSMKEMEKFRSVMMHKGIIQASYLLNAQQLDAFSYFHGLGDTIEHTIYKNLRGGMDTYIRDIDVANNYIDDILKGKKIQDWTGPHAKAKTIPLSGGREVKLTIGQIMDLYLLNKREQARGHIYGYGIHPVDMRAKGEKGKIEILHQEKPVVVTPDEVDKITALLTPEQKAVADKLQLFLATTAADWNNETSMRLYNRRKYTEANYWPITSDRDFIPSNSSDAETSYHAIKNQGYTKALKPGANNPIYIGDVFDTFIRHIMQSASYHSYAAPILDAMRWFNYKNENGTVKQSIRRTKGAKGLEYFLNFMKAINGTTAREVSIGTPEVMIRNMKTASVAANIGVIIQQPTSYLRAAALISPKYLTAAVFHKANLNKVLQYCPIAKWKSWGFFDVNIGKSMRELMIGDTGRMEKIRNAALQPAQWADNITWITLWNACELEIKDTRKDLTPGSEEFNQAVGDRLSEVVDKTQVVDSIFHRSQIMRNRSFGYQAITSFMSEPTKMFNMVRNAIVDVAHGKPEAGKMLVRTGAAVLVSVMLNAAVRSLMQALRMKDDDEADTYGKKYLKALFGYKGNWQDILGSNFVDGVNLFNYIPVSRDLVSIVKGYGVERMDMQGLTAFINSIKAWVDKATGDSKASTYKLIYDSANALSTLTGIPAYNLMRDFNSFYNTFSKEPIDMQSETATAKKAYEGLYKAILSGDAAKQAELRKALSVMKEGPKSPNEIDVGIATQLMENDPRIARAYSARKGIDIQLLKSLRNEIIASGFSGEIVDKAINLYENANKDYVAIYDAMKGKDPAKAQQLRNALISDKIRPAKADDVDVGVAKVMINKDTRIADAYKAMKMDNQGQYQDIRSKIIADGFDAKLVDLAIGTYEKTKTKELDAPLYSYDDLYAVFRNAANTGNYTNIDDVFNQMVADSDAKDPKQAVRDQVIGTFKKEYLQYINSGDQYKADGIGNALKAKFDVTDDDLNDWVLADKNKKVKESITNGEIETANKFILEEKDLGRKDSTIAASITALIKPKVIELYNANDTDGIDDIINNLGALELYAKNGGTYYTYDFVWSWIEDYIKEQESK